jgi:hypothetical protein
MTTEKNVIKVATKQQKDNLKELFKSENIKESEVVEGGRTALTGRWVLKL